VGAVVRAVVPARVRRLVARALDGVPRWVVVATVCGVVVVWLVCWQVLVRGPGRAGDARVAAAQATVARLEADLDRYLSVRGDLRAVGASTLSGSRSEAAHLFRTRLSELAAAAGLSRVVVDERSGEERVNPLVGVQRAGSGLASVRSRLRRTPDFGLIRGTVTAEGTLEQAMAFLAHVEAQPWLHAVERVDARPLGKERERTSITIEVGALHVPDLVARGHVAPALAAMPTQGATRARQLAERDPFRFARPAAPPAVVAVAPEAQPEPRAEPAPPPPPFHEWRVAAVMDSPKGPEVILVHGPSGQSLIAVVGEGVLSAKLVEVRGSLAVFELEGTLVEVESGETLASRRPTHPVHSGD
jgi:hypothetical protein